VQLNPFRRRAVAATEPARTTPPKTQGASGTINFRGFLQTEEYNPDLQGDRALRAFDKMLRSDGAVQESMEHIFAPIKNATAYVEPPENPDPDELIATALVRDAFFKTLHQPFLEYLDQALDYLSFGHQVFETSWQVVDRELEYEVPGEFDTSPDGKRIPRTETVPQRQWLVWDRFEQRMQKTLFQWHVHGGMLESITQQVFNSDTAAFEFPTLDAADLVVLTNKRRGDDFTGRSVLRSAYKAWYLKELIEKVEAVSLERWGVGIPIAYPPISAKDDAAVISRLEDILANLKAGESTYIVAPGPKQGAGPNGGEGYLFEILSPTGTPPDFKSAKEYHRAEIKAAVLARFAELGHQAVGARSTGDVQSIVWFAALHAVARYISDVHDPPIRRLCSLNLPGLRRFPKLAFSGIEEKDILQFAQAVSQVIASGAMRADASARSWVRDSFDAPPEDEIDDSQPVDPAADPNAGPNAPPDPNAKPKPKSAAARRRPDPAQLRIEEE